MRLLNIASGSSGNSSYIGDDQTHILVDAGISRKRIVDGLNDADIDFSDISAILITHEHIDHISSLGILARTRDIPIYATAGTIRGIKECNSLGEFDFDLFNEISADISFDIGDINITPVSISHDANDPVAFRFDDGKTKAAIITDLGEYDEYILESLKGLDMLMIEANHDIRMLEAGPYPYVVKQRIAGNKGHLSNENSGKLLSSLLHDNIKEIMLAHISKENNTHELAKISVEAEINISDNKFKSSDFELHIARHDKPSMIFEA